MVACYSVFIDVMERYDLSVNADRYCFVNLFKNIYIFIYFFFCENSLSAYIVLMHEI